MRCCIPGPLRGGEKKGKRKGEWEREKRGDRKRKKRGIEECRMQSALYYLKSSPSPRTCSSSLINRSGQGGGEGGRKRGRGEAKGTQCDQRKKKEGGSTHIERFSLDPHTLHHGVVLASERKKGKKGDFATTKPRGRPRYLLAKQVKV